ncbi:MAG: hypothetical protein ABW155_17535 [Candidatus Thiodiazotropha sp.]
MKSKQILESIDINYYLKTASTAYFSDLCAGLYHLESNVCGLGKDILTRIDNNHLLRKFENEKFEKVGPAIKQLYFVDETIANTLLRTCNTRQLANKAKILSINKLSNTLDNISSTNNEVAKNILDNIDVNLLSRKVLKSSRHNSDQALSRFERIDPKYSKHLKSRIRKIRARRSPSC